MINNIKQLIDNIELCNFECEGGSLEKCIPWIELKYKLRELTNNWEVNL